MPSKLRNPRQALGDYLDEMLHQATGEAAPEALLEARPRVVLPVHLPVQEIDDEIDNASDEPEIADAGPNPEQTRADDAAPKPATAADTELEFPLQCLMFRVGEHLLSVPLIQLSSVVNWSDRLTRLPQAPDWLLGLIKVRETNLRVVDSGHLLEINTARQQQPEHLLVLGDSGWAISCDHLEQVVSLERDEIQWKSGGDRVMVLGTIRDSLATLISPPGIAAELDSRGRPEPDG